METNRGIFLSGETTGYITDTITMASGDSDFVGREIIEDSDSTTERVLFMSCADDDSQTPTIAVAIAFTFDEGTTWTDYTTIQKATTVPTKIQVSAYGSSWWVKNTGVKFKITKSGAGAVTITGARWI